MLAQALVQASLVCRQTQRVFHRIVVVGQPVENGAASLLCLAFFDLIELALQSFCTFVGAAELIAETSLATLLLKLIPQLCPLAHRRSLALGVSTQRSVDSFERRECTGQNLSTLASQRSVGHLDCSTLHVAQEVERAEHRVVLGVDRSKVAGDRSRHAHRTAKAVGVQVLQGRHHSGSARIVAVKEHVTVFAIDAGSEHIELATGSRVHLVNDLLFHQAGLRILLALDTSLNRLLHNALGIRCAKAHGHQFFDDLVDVFGIRIHREPEAGVGVLYGQAIGRQGHTVLVGSHDRTLTLHGNVGQDVHHVAL